MTYSVFSSLPLHRNIILYCLRIAFVLVSGLFSLKYLFIIVVSLYHGNIYNDFFHIWSYAKFVIINSPTKIYDNSMLHDFQIFLGGAPHKHAPYPYPPSFLLLIWPLGFVSYYLSYLVWFFLTFSFYLIISLRQRWRSSVALICTFAPASILTFAFGQTGFLFSALILSGFYTVSSYPIMSGILFGLVSLKPQLGILIPIALISARLWLPLVASGMTVLVLVFASSAAFGWSIWAIWLAKLPVYANWSTEINNNLKPTIMANLVSLGVNVPVARAIQIFSSIVVAIIIWASFRRGATTLATAGLIAGTFLAVPYAFVYDMPMVTNAVLAVISVKYQTNRAMTIPETFVLGLSLIVPAIMVETWRLSMLSSIPLILLFGLIVAQIIKSCADAPKSDPAQLRRAEAVAPTNSAE